MDSVQQLKLEICDIGRRMYGQGFAAGNGGNISVRLNEREVLCTPTLVSKGSMKPDDLCTVDMEGKQLSGTLKRSSEILLHLTIMKARPDVKSVTHCHPPHATAFGVAREPIPQCVMPEAEVMLGEVPIAKYALPGTQEFADTVLPFVKNTNVIILANHGTVSYGETAEQAFWLTEILDNYCRTLMLARDLGRLSFLSETEVHELLEFKRRIGFLDPRLDPARKDGDVCGNAASRDTWKEVGVERRAFEACPSTTAKSKGETPVDQEALVRAITQQVLKALGKI